MTVGAALALFTGMSTSSAQAATGTFAYHSPESGDLEIKNPDNGECRLLLQGADSAANNTDATAFLFTDQGCEMRHSSLAPGESRVFPGPALPHSVLFES